MATKAELEQVRRALNKLTASALSDLTSVFASLKTSDRVMVKRALAGAYPEILAEYGRASAALGADLVEAWASELGVRPRVMMASPLSAKQATGAVEWALTRPDPAASLDVLTDQFVKQPYRDTVQRSAHESGVAWARVPSGSQTCAFCLMTASRGAVYRTSATAGSDYKWHGGCDCQVVMVRNEADYPEGYDPGAALDLYLTARGNVEGNPTTNAILAEMRKITGDS